MSDLSDDEFFAITDRMSRPASLVVLLDEVARFIGDYVVMPHGGVIAATLWCAHAHALDAFDATPRLAVMAPEKNSGKTRTLEVIRTLVPNPMHTSSVSTSVLFRSIDGSDRPTVLLDECDAIWNGRGVNEELRALVNAGHRKGADALRMVGEGKNMQPRRFKQYAAMALAGVGTLPETVADRSVTIPMRRRKASETVQRWREREAEPQGHELRRLLAEWVGEQEDKLAELRPAIPDDIRDRQADVWEPLYAVAELAGGDWPADCLRACRLLTADSPEQMSTGVRLLTDLRELWPLSLSWASTDYLLRELSTVPPWSNPDRPLSGRRLASLLKPYGIKPGSTGTERGYRREDMTDGWDRYCDPTPTNPSEPSEASEQPPTDASDGIDGLRKGAT